MSSDLQRPASRHEPHIFCRKDREDEWSLALTKWLTPDVVVVAAIVAETLFPLRRVGAGNQNPSPPIDSHVCGPAPYDIKKQSTIAAVIVAAA